MAVEDVVLSRLRRTSGWIQEATAVRLSFAQALGLRWLAGWLDASPTAVLQVLIVREHSVGDLRVDMSKQLII